MKGNCKFGHKCALAHVLPGQSMAMDRKNKKAAQQAASGGKDGGAKGGRGNSRRDAPRNPLLASGSGGRAPAGRPPITLPSKARASAPAPGLKETDFASLLEDKLEGKEDKKSLSGSPETTPKNEEAPRVEAINAEPSIEKVSKSASPVSLPMSARKPPSQSPRNPPLDFGPIGSPPRATSSASPARALNGISPGTSPSQRAANGFLSSSPFSAPGSQSMFMLDDQQNRGMTASLGAGLTMGGGFGRGNRSGYGLSSSQVPQSALALRAEDDGDMEDFIPSSLSDLLTPEERSRRMSRSNSGQGGTPLTAGHLADQLQQGVGLSSSLGQGGSGHRYSRSVPAQSLLGDISAIWSEKSGNQAPVGLPASPSHLNVGNGTPSSFTSNSFGGRSFTEEHSYLNPSNASAAFLPGNMHHHLAPKQALSSNLGRGFRDNGQLSQRAASGNIQRAPFNASPSSHRPIPLQPEIPADDPNLLSPNARALHAHAPGQSLPQGLAAGYSRIHALPALPLPSPSSTAGFSVSPGPTNMFAQGPYGTNLTGNDWHAAGTGSSPHYNAGNDSMDAMLSKLSYSAATQRAPGPPGIQRNVSGNGRWGQGPPPMSPLSGPVVAGDDDDLFTLE